MLVLAKKNSHCLQFHVGMVGIGWTKSSVMIKSDVNTQGKTYFKPDAMLYQLSYEALLEIGQE